MKKRLTDLLALPFSKCDGWKRMAQLQKLQATDSLAGYDHKINSHCKLTLPTSILVGGYANYHLQDALASFFKYLQQGLQFVGLVVDWATAAASGLTALSNILSCLTVPCALTILQGDSYKIASCESGFALIKTSRNQASSICKR